MKKVYEIGVHGVDDSTIFKMELTDEEYKIVNKVAKLCTDTSKYPCMPVMYIAEIENNNT